MTTPKSRVYVLTDAENRITRLEGEYTLPDDLTGWTKIDEGYGDRFSLAQSHYLEKSLYANDGILRYKLVDNQPVERDNEEIAADVAKNPKIVTPSEQLRADVDFIAAMTGVEL